MICFDVARTWLDESWHVILMCLVNAWLESEIRTCSASCLMYSWVSHCQYRICWWKHVRDMLRYGARYVELGTYDGIHFFSESFLAVLPYPGCKMWMPRCKKAPVQRLSRERIMQWHAVAFKYTYCLWMCLTNFLNYFLKPFMILHARRAGMQPIEEEV